MLHQQEAGRLAPCANKRLRILEQRPRVQVSAYVLGGQIDRVADPASLVGQVWSSLQVRLSFKGLFYKVREALFAFATKFSVDVVCHAWRER